VPKKVREAEELVPEEDDRIEVDVARDEAEDEAEGLIKGRAVVQEVEAVSYHPTPHVKGIVVVEEVVVELVQHLQLEEEIGGDGEEEDEEEEEDVDEVEDEDEEGEGDVVGKALHQNVLVHRKES